jgi:hypothetical protein
MTMVSSHVGSHAAAADVRHRPPDRIPKPTPGETSGVAVSRYHYCAVFEMFDAGCGDPVSV